MFLIKLVNNDIDIRSRGFIKCDVSYVTEKVFFQGTASA